VAADRRGKRCADRRVAGQRLGFDWLSLALTDEPPAAKPTESQLALEVAFAPYQKIPRDKARKDAQVGTIDRDPEFLAFLEELNKPKEVSEGWSEGSRGAVRSLTMAGVCRKCQARMLSPTRRRASKPRSPWRRWSSTWTSANLATRARCVLP